MQVIIDHHYNLLYRINLYTVVFPAIVQAVLFWFWHNFVLIVRMRWLLMEELNLDEDEDEDEDVDRLLSSRGNNNK